MRSKIFAACTAAALLAVPTAGQAQDLRFIFTQCGIGGAVTDDPDIAVIVNILTSLPTAITQGVLAPDSCTGSAASRAAFMASSYDQLEVETAMGEGKYLMALLDHAQCDEAQRAVVIDEIRGDLATLAATEGYSSMETKEKAEEMFVSFSNSVGATCPAG